MASSAIVGTLRALLSADVAEFVSAMGKGADASEKFQKQVTATGETFKDVGIRSGSLKNLILELSGAFDKRKAEEYAVAITKIGGANKLTAADQARVNGIMTQALDHYRALGKEAPAHFVEIAKATKQVQAPTDALLGSAGKLAGVLGVAFTGTAAVAGLKAIVGHAIETGARINDLSAKLGVSAEFVQRLSYVAGQGGTDIETFQRAIATMNTTLVGGDKSTEKALQIAGLELDKIRAMKPQDAFLAITEAIKTIPDPMLQAKVATELFGKAGQDLLPAIKAGIKEVGDQTTVMSDETVKRLADAANAWAKFKTEATIASGEMVGTILRDFGRLKQNLPYLLADIMHPGTGIGQAMAESDRVAEQKLREEREKNAKATAESAAKAREKAKADEAGAEASRKAAAAQKAYNEEIQRGADKISTRGLAAEVKKTHAELMRASTLSAEGFELLGKRTDDLIMKGAKLTPELSEIHAAWVGMHAPLDTHLGDVDKLLGLFQNLAPAIFRASAAELEFAQKIAEARKAIWFDPTKIGTPIKIGPAPADRSVEASLKKALGNAAAAFPDMLAQAIIHGGSIREAFRAILVNVGGDFGRSFGESLAKEGSKMSKFLGNVLGPLGAIGGDLIGKAFEKIFNIGSKGRDLVKDFADKMGGFDELHKKLSVLGAEGERLWVRFTQGVGRNNPEQAKAAIQAIEDALARAEQEAKDAAAATAAFNGKLDLLAGKLSGFQTTAPASLRGLVDELRNASGLTDDLRGQLDRLAGTPSWEDMEGKAEKFGIKLDALGGTFQQLKSNAKFDELNDLLTEFNDNGADMAGVFEGVSDEVNTLVQNALKFGTDVPEYMRPWLERMAAAGLLIDESGDKLTDLGKLKFSDTIESSFDRMAKVLGEIRDLLAKGLPNAAKDAAKGVNDELSKIKPPPVKVPIEFAYDDPYGGHGHDQELFGGATPSYAHEGFLKTKKTIIAGDWPSGEFVLHKETVQALINAAMGGSYRPTSVPAILTPMLPAIGAGGSFGATAVPPSLTLPAGGGANNMTVQVILDGKVLAESNLRHGPGVAKLFGLVR